MRRGGIPLRDLVGDSAHLFVDKTVGGEDDWSAKLIGISGEIGDLAAGFFDEEDARGGIPLLQVKFPEAIEAAGGDAGKIERRRAVAADAVGALREVTVVLKIGAGFAVAHGEAGAEEARGKRGDFGDADFFAVEGGAFAAGGGKKFAVERIEDHGGEKRVALSERDGNAKTRIAVREVGGAVERIDVPAEFGSSFLAGAFFGGDGMVREIFVEARDDELFRAFIGLGDEIHFVAFVADVQRARQFFDKDFAGFLGDFDGGFKVVFGHGNTVRLLSTSN
jgi:hypothetical protein